MTMHRELLGDTKWLNFEQVVAMAREPRRNAGQPATDHFANVGRKVDTSFTRPRGIEDAALPRCAQNRQFGHTLTPNWLTGRGRTASGPSITPQVAPRSRGVPQDAENKSLAARGPFSWRHENGRENRPTRRCPGSPTL
jgi:hypothetical protein